jgi:RHS repeat-associated protein
MFSRTPASGTASYLLTDALGSTVGLADTSGVVQTSYTYEPFGNTTVSGAANTNPFAFTGREIDSAGTLRLYDYRARAYSPTLQRFLTEDPMGFAGGAVNMYAYVGDSPLNFIDPLGLGREGPPTDCEPGATLCGLTYRLYQAYQCLSYGILGAFFGSFIGPEGTVGGALAGCVVGLKLPPSPPGNPI